MARLSIHHVTTYSYAQPVKFGPHHWMFRPRDTHDLRLLDMKITVQPDPELRWYHDVFGNSIAIARFEAPARELRFESRIELEHYGVELDEFPVDDVAHSLPFVYPTREQPDLARTIERHYPDPEGEVADWARKFLSERGRSRTSDVLGAMTEAIRQDFRYQARDEPGVQTPTETLEMGSGSCRDFAIFFMEAARSLGLAARFVTGYLYDPALDGVTSLEVRGAGTTHAWAQVYLPGAGWIEMDPTNGIVGSTNLFRVGVGRTPEQAMPLRGTFEGNAADYRGMNVQVTVNDITPVPPRRVGANDA
jgi:transglutaminase-like putative cysteine protease